MSSKRVAMPSPTCGGAKALFAAAKPRVNKRRGDRASELGHAIRTLLGQKRHIIQPKYNPNKKTHGELAKLTPKEQL